LSDIITLQEAAGIFRVTEKAIRDWIVQGMPVQSKGSRGGGKKRDKTTLDLREAVEWYFEENFERLELDRQRTRLAAEQAQKIAIENARSIEALGDLDDWQREAEQFHGEIRAALLALPTKEAPRLDGDVNQRQERLKQAIHEVLRKLAAYRPGQAAPRDAEAVDGDREGVHAAAGPDGKPVGRPLPKAVKGKQRRARRVAH
jgi:phage terminase Nu1 subunit (DNA packaging protein)